MGFNVSQQNKQAILMSTIKTRVSASSTTRTAITRTLTLPPIHFHAATMFTNLFICSDEQAVGVTAVRAGLEPQVTAQKIADLARQRALEKDRKTPFSASAQEAGFRYYGGKLADITVVVSYITSSKDDESSSQGSS